MDSSDISTNLQKNIESIKLEFIDAPKLVKKDIWDKFYTAIENYIDIEFNSGNDTNVNASDIILMLTTELNIANNAILESETAKNRRLNEIYLDVLNHVLENYTEYSLDIGSSIQDTFKYYPEYTDPNFNKKIYEKKEFHENQIKKLTENKTNTTSGFKRSPPQKFVKNFISNNTPYSGLILWHGVGVGKTCAAISIAENFRDFVYLNDKRILVLTPSDTLQQNWKDEIFSVEKERNRGDKNVQCTGSRYINELNDFDNKTNKQNTLQVNRLINKYYEIMGYQKLASSIERQFKVFENWVKPSVLESRKIRYIRERFSNRVIIMDEVHETREDGRGDIKKVPPYLEMIARYSTNTKLILCTATPMYNVTQEIIWLLNLLLWNDNRAPIEYHHIFKTDGITLVNNVDSLKTLTDKSRGYISYVRGGDPFTFPIRISPLSTNLYTPSPESYNEGGTWKKLLEADKINQGHLSLYKDPMSNWQYKHLHDYMPSETNELRDGDDGLEQIDTAFQASKKSSGFETLPLQASNIVFPSYEDTIKGDIKLLEEPIGIIGPSAFDRTFPKIGANNKFKYSSSYGMDLGNIDKTGKSFLHLDYIGKYSTKFRSIIENILTSKGIVFVYSQFILHGVKPLAFALEENGFQCYTGNGVSSNMLDKQLDKRDCFCAYHKKYYRDLTPAEIPNFKQAKYIYLDGDISKKNLDTMVKEVRGEGYNSSGQLIPNLNGEHIMVILGSRVVEKGISFFNTREIHILDPWHHLNMMEQAIGRGTRRYSHKNLEREKHNVSLFLHSATEPIDINNGNESIDERVYRRAYLKKYKMAQVERELKRNAVDCQLNKYGNMMLKANLNPDTVQMLDSKGNNIAVKMYDEDNSIFCDFDKCEYSCVPFDRNEKITVNSDTYTEEFAKDDIETAKEYIKSLFIHDSAYHIDDIITILPVIIGAEIGLEYIYIALNDIVSKNEEVVDMYNRKGKVIARDGIYIYQLNDLDNDNTPLYYRRTPLSNKRRHIQLKDTQIISQIKKEQAKARILKLKMGKQIKPKTDQVAVLGIIIKTLDIKKAETYIKTTYKEYPSEPDKCRTKYEPTIKDLVRMYIFSKIDSMSYEHKLYLFKHIFKDIIEKTPLNDLHREVALYCNKTVDKDGSNLIITVGDKYKDIRGRDTKDDTPNIIRLVKSNGQTEMFEYREGEFRNDSLSITDEQQRQLTMRPLPFLDNNSLIYGFYKDWKGALTFNVINNTGYKKEHNRDGKLRMKKVRTGARCGHATNVTKINEIVETINTVLEFQKYTVSKPEGMRTSRLCEELELILRYRQFILPNKEMEISQDGSGMRWFYKAEEIYLMNL